MGILVIGILSVVLFMLMLFIARIIAKPVAEASDLAEIMAKGDFTKKLNITQHDEVGILAGSLNAMAGNLSKMIREIIAGVETLSSSSSGLADVSRQLSNGARDTSDKSSAVAAAAEEMSTNIQSVSASMEQSSSNINMVASAMEEMTSTVSEIAQNAERPALSRRVRFNSRNRLQRKWVSWVSQHARLAGLRKQLPKFLIRLTCWRSTQP
jgi:methyl-accepting chemotaxis protein